MKKSVITISVPDDETIENLIDNLHEDHTGMLDGAEFELVETQPETTQERKYIYKMFISCGRQGDLESTFIATEEQINQLVGKEAYFSEPFGKFSEVSGTYDAENFTRIDCDESAVAVVESLGILPTGFYPFDYVVE